MDENMKTQIKERYSRGYVTKAQLEKFVTLGALTEDEAAAIVAGGETGPVEGMIATAELDAAYREGVNRYAG